MSTRTSDYLDAIEHLPDGASLVLQEFSWEDYERLLEDLRERPHLRVCYDQGRVEIMSPLPEHEEYTRFIDDLVRAIANKFGLQLQKYGSATWKRQKLARGVEPDSCYYVGNAARVIGKRKFDLDVDPAPDIVVEIDITNESLSKFSIYAALLVSEIWRYDGKKMRFYRLTGKQYQEVSRSISVPRLKPQMLADALEESKTVGQTAALAAFSRQL